MRTRSRCGRVGGLIVSAIVAAFAANGFDSARAVDRIAPKIRDEIRIHTDDWTSFRNGDQLRGIADSSLADELELLWEYPAPDGVAATAAIVGERVFVGQLSGELVCLDRRTGKLLWKYTSIENPKPNDFLPGFKASPTVTADAVYAGDEDGVLHAVDPAGGEKLWTFQTGAEIISSATVVGEKVIFGSYDNTLYCLDAKTGEKQWGFMTDGYVNCTPAVIGKYTFVTGCDEHLRVIDIESGEEHVNMPLMTYLIASPAARGGLLYFGTYASEVIAVDWNKQEIVWRYKDDDREFPYHSSAAVTEERVVVGGRDKQMHCIDRKSGEGVWKYATRGRIDGSPVVVGKRVFFGSSDRNLYALSLNDGKELWKYNTGKEITASPAVGQGVLVIGAEGSNASVMCFGKK